MGRRLRVRLVAVAAASGALAMGLGIRMFAGSDAVAQYSGTALYASMIYAGVLMIVPDVRPYVAGTAAIAFCWLVEFLQLTGVPATLSEHSVLARLVLGRQFDAADLAWYAVGVVPLVILHRVLVRAHFRRAVASSSCRCRACE